MTDLEKCPVMLMVDTNDGLEGIHAPGLSLTDAARLLSLELVFSTDEPEQESYYLVAGRLEAPNGFVGVQFVVCCRVGEVWFTAPDGEEITDGLPMWDGHSADPYKAPFKPLKWARLPQGIEE